MRLLVWGAGSSCKMYINVYIWVMSKRYSIAEARRNLPALVDEAQAGREVELTRRGRPVAVVVSVDQYARLTRGGEGFADAYSKFRESFPEGRGGVPRRFLRSLRDRGAGRKVRL
jgi:prevent-host-death family protein